jgi:hypothetical protein
MGTWTRDGGDGVDDLACFFMSSGEVIIYQGSNPGDAADWALVGVFRIGPPLGVRSVVKVGPDLIVMTKDGYFPLSKIINIGRGSTKGAISDQINGAVIDAARAYSSNYGWQSVLYPKGNQLLFNVPVSEGVTYHQHVFNTLTGAPCKFTGMNARCWGVYNDELYFGGDGEVFKADNGTSDDGELIDADCLPAYTYLGSRAKIKQVTASQPVMSSEGAFPVALTLAVDFKSNAPEYISAVYSVTGAEWDVALWDSADWTGGTVIMNDWYSTGGIGMNFALRLRVRTKSRPVHWYSTNYMFKTGGLM